MAMYTITLLQLPHAFWILEAGSCCESASVLGTTPHSGHGCANLARSGTICLSTSVSHIKW